MNYFKNNKTANLLITILIILNVSLMVFIFVQYDMWKTAVKKNESKQERTSHIMKESLNLSESQQNLFRESGQAYFEQMKKISPEIKKLKRNLYEEIFEINPNKDKINEILEELSVQHKELEIAKFEHFQELKEICNPEQEEKLKEVIKSMIDRMEIRHHGQQKHRGRQHRNRK